MAKPKAPRWLTEAFRDGVDERVAKVAERIAMPSLFNPPPQHPFCQLAPHDLLQRPCSGSLERFHFVPRQRVENALGVLLPVTRIAVGLGMFEPDYRSVDRALILLAAWNPRNGGIACEHHHRRLDSHATPSLIVPHAALPNHVIEFAADWGLESELQRRYPKREEAAMAAPERSQP